MSVLPPPNDDRPPIERPQLEPGGQGWMPWVAWSVAFVAVFVVLFVAFV